MVRTAKNEPPETLRLDRGEWIKIGGMLVACLASIAGAGWNIAGAVREAAVAYEARMTKVETRIDGHAHELELHGRRIDTVEGQLRGEP